ncbi:MAG: GNAT family N-acetyltransferase [Ornithinimicrobium sp.]
MSDPDTPTAARPDHATNEAAFSIQMARDAQDCRRASDLLNLVWQMPPGQDVLELSTLVAYVHSGCYVTSAVEAGTGTVVAASVAFFGPPGTSLHSHITGVHPAWAGQGVGRAMKEHQREWCRTRGVQAITWTFDPLVARNAFFNLNVLGARVTGFLPDHYGPMNDGRNAGHGSDRLMVTWDLTTSPTVTTHQIPADAYLASSSGPRRHVAVADRSGQPGTPDTSVPAACEEVEIALPRDIETLREADPETATAWRARLREVLPFLLSSGWQVDRFESPGRYVLTRNPRQVDP